MGHNRDKEKLPQLNLAMLFGQKSALPVYYHRVPGNISDVSTLRNLVLTFKALEVKRLHYVMDKGFYSRKNVDALAENRDRFTLSVPLSNKWLLQAIDDIHETIYGPVGYRKVDDEVIYVHSRLYPWGKEKRRCYLHLYYNATNRPKMWTSSTRNCSSTRASSSRASRWPTTRRPMTTFSSRSCLLYTSPSPRD